MNKKLLLDTVLYVLAAFLYKTKKVLCQVKSFGAYGAALLKREKQRNIYICRQENYFFIINEKASIE